jgi:hypothetical protein
MVLSHPISERLATERNALFAWCLGYVDSEHRLPLGIESLQVLHEWGNGCLVYPSDSTEYHNGASTR